MAEQKDNSGQAARSAQSTKRPSQPGQSGGVPDAFAAPDHLAGDDRPDGRPDSAPGSGTGAGDKTSATVVRRKQRYLIGFRSLPGIMSLPSDPFLERLAQMDNVEIIRRLPGNAAQTAPPASNGAAPTAMSSETIVVRMDEQRGESLRQNAPPHVIVERDAPLGYSDMLVPEPWNWQHSVQAMPFPRPRRELRFRVLGEGERPLANAVINMYGPGFPAQAVTDFLRPGEFADQRGGRQRHSCGLRASRGRSLGTVYPKSVARIRTSQRHSVEPVGPHLSKLSRGTPL